MARRWGSSWRSVHRPEGLLPGLEENRGEREQIQLCLEKNYSFLERRRIRAFVKYNMFRREGEKSFHRQVYREENMPYDEALDRFTCPAGRHLTFHHEQHKVSENGFQSVIRIYQGHRCGTCEHRPECCSGEAIGGSRLTRTWIGCEAWPDGDWSHPKD